MAFDPYAEWLGIAKDQRPPTHYALLGLADGESDLDKIRERANARFSAVHGYCVGKRENVARKVAGELAQAVACLTNPKRKQEYDRQLQQPPGGNLILLLPDEPPSSADGELLDAEVLDAEVVELEAGSANEALADEITLEPLEDEAADFAADFATCPQCRAVVAVSRKQFSDPLVFSVTCYYCAADVPFRDSLGATKQLPAAPTSNLTTATRPASSIGSSGGKPGKNEAPFSAPLAYLIGVGAIGLIAVGGLLAAIISSFFPSVKNPERLVLDCTTERSREELQDLQQKWAEQLKTTTEAYLGIGAKLLLVPAGRFTIGAPDSDSNAEAHERPQQQVEIKRPFFIQTTEVTQKQWIDVMATEPWRRRENVQVGDHYPAVYISYIDAIRFCDKLTLKEDLGSEWAFRLPTEAQWEYACRAGTRGRFSFNDARRNMGEYMWSVTNTADVEKEYAQWVGQKRPNPLGLYDMHGNVAEWCLSALLPYDSSKESDPISSGAVVRGGSWRNHPFSCRSPFRDSNDSAALLATVGFRIVLVQKVEDSISPRAVSPPQFTLSPDSVTLPEEVEAPAAVALAKPDKKSKKETAPSKDSVAEKKPEPPEDKSPSAPPKDDPSKPDRGSPPQVAKTRPKRPPRPSRPEGSETPEKKPEYSSTAEKSGTPGAAGAGGADPASAGLSSKKDSAPSTTKPADPPPLFDATLPRTATEFQTAQAAWAKTLEKPAVWVVGSKTSRRRETSPSPATAEFALIPPGRFMMGAAKSDRDAKIEERPQHLVLISQPFYMQTTEVTQQLWTSVMRGAKAPWLKKTSRMKVGPQYPASYVSWDQAVNFCVEWTKAERRAKRIDDDWVFRLPTEAQWEYACRGGTLTRFSFGDDETALPQYGWFRKTMAGKLHALAVRQKLPNAFGLYDMHGNVAEWVRGGLEKYGRDPRKDPQAAAVGSKRIYRGGGWNKTASFCRVSKRLDIKRSTNRPDIGFRAVLVKVELSD